MSEHADLSRPAWRVLFFMPRNLGPYHQARFNALVRGGVDVTVAACPVAEHPRPWRMGTELLFGMATPFSDAGSSWRSIYRAARRALRAESPDAAFIVGYGSRYVIASALAARRLRIPAVLVLIGWRHERRRRWLTEQVKRAICRVAFEYAVVPGIRAEEYATWLGIRNSRCFRIGNVVDNSHFESGEPDESPLHFVTISRIAVEKNLFRLIEAYQHYRAGGGRWGLRIYGDGPLRESVERRIAQVEGIDLFPWVDYSDVPGVLASASAFVLVSELEPWGLVVNEAMAAGLPVVVSRRSGCYPELCRPGSNGYGVDPSSPVDIAEALARVSALTDAERSEMGRRSRMIIEEFSLDSWTSGVVRVLSDITRAGSTC